MTQKLLTISILVSGREETVFRCLESLEPLRRAVDTEVILVDTGCNAKLLERMAPYATKIVPFQWCNDFSKARNAGLAEATGQWFLYLDDDEWFTEMQDLIDFFQRGEYCEYTSASYVQRNYLDMDGSQYTDTRVARMAQITSELHFQSKIHEYLTPTGNHYKNLTATVEHYGYVYATEEDKLAHFKRNQKLLDEMIKEEPDKLRWRLQLLQEYRSIDDFAKMEELGNAGITMINGSGNSDGEEACVYIGSFYAARILAADGQGDYNRVYSLCQAAAGDARNTGLCKAFLNEMCAKACFYRGFLAQNHMYAQAQYRESEQYAQAYLAAQEYYKVHKEALFREQIAPFVGECLDVVKQKEIYSIRICNGLKLGSVDNLQKYIDKLCWNEQHVYVFEEIAGVLIETMNRFAMAYENRKIPANGEYAVYEETLQTMRKQHALWEYFCGQIERKEEQGVDMSGIIRLIRLALPNEVSETAATADLEPLVLQIQEQIQLLITNGMREQALITIQQLKKIIPQDERLQKLEQMCGEYGDRNQ